MLFGLLTRASSYASKQEVCKPHKAGHGILWINATFNIFHTCIQVICTFSFLAAPQGGEGGEAGGCCSPIPCAFLHPPFVLFFPSHSADAMLRTSTGFSLAIHPSSHLPTRKSSGTLTSQNSKDFLLLTLSFLNPKPRAK